MKKIALYLMGSALVVNLIALAVSLVIFWGKREALCIKQETISEIQPDTIYKTQLIDLGLPSGTLWADRNIGADAPEEYGDYFRFGETTPFTEESSEYCYDDIEENIAGTDKDAATVILGKGYKMPTLKQIKELLKKCKWEWTSMNGVKGMKVIGPNCKSIFLPAAGFRNYRRASLSYIGIYGYYWSASAVDNNEYTAYTLRFHSGNLDLSGCSDQSYGCPVRAVAKKSM